MRFAAVRAGGGISIAHQLLEFGSAIVALVLENRHNIYFSGKHAFGGKHAAG